MLSISGDPGSSPACFRHPLVELLFVMRTLWRGAQQAGAPPAIDSTPIVWAELRPILENHRAFQWTATLLQQGVSFAQLLSFVLSAARNGTTNSAELLGVGAEEFSNQYWGLLTELVQERTVSQWVTETGAICHRLVTRVRELMQGIDPSANVAAFLHEPMRWQCTYLPVLTVPSGNEKHGVLTSGPTGPTVDLLFQVNVADRMTDEEFRDFLRVGAYYQLASAYLRPHLPSLRAMMDETEGLLEPMMGSPCQRLYKDWPTILTKHLISAVAFALEREAPEWRAQSHDRAFAASGMLYLEPMIDLFLEARMERRSLAAVLQEVMTGIIRQREELRQWAEQIPFRGPIRWFFGWYWQRHGLCVVLDGDGPVSRLVADSWGGLPATKTPPDQNAGELFIGRVGSFPLLVEQLRTAGFQVGPDFVQTPGGRWYGEGLQLVLVGRDQVAPWRCWAGQVAWTEESLLPVSGLQAEEYDYLVLRGDERIGQGRYLP